MKRIKDANGIVHFRNPGNRTVTLCGETAVVDTEPSLFRDDSNEVDGFPETRDVVICPVCAKVFCSVKNEPWNAISDKALDDGIYTAVREDSEPWTDECKCPGYDSVDCVTECLGTGCRYYGKCDFSMRCILEG